MVILFLSLFTCGSSAAMTPPFIMDDAEEEKLFTAAIFPVRRAGESLHVIPSTRLAPSSLDTRRCFTCHHQLHDFIYLTKARKSRVSFSPVAVPSAPLTSDALDY